jgi:hypothetical protein
MEQDKQYQRSNEEADAIVSTTWKRQDMNQHGRESKMGMGDI